MRMSTEIIDIKRGGGIGNKARINKNNDDIRVTQ